MKNMLPGIPLPNETKRAYPKEWERGPKTPEQGINDPKLEDFSERLKKEAEPEKLKHEDLKPGEHMIDALGDLVVRNDCIRAGILHDGPDTLYCFPKSKRVYRKDEIELKNVKEKGDVDLKNGEYWIDKSGGLALEDHEGNPHYFPKMKRVYPEGSWPPADEDMKLHYTEALERLKKVESDNDKFQAENQSLRDMVLDVEAKAGKEIDEVYNEIIKTRADAEYQADLNTKLTEELSAQINLTKELQAKLDKNKIDRHPLQWIEKVKTRKELQKEVCELKHELEKFKLDDQLRRGKELDEIDEDPPPKGCARCIHEVICKDRQRAIDILHESGIVQFKIFDHFEQFCKRFKSISQDFPVKMAKLKPW